MGELTYEAAIEELQSIVNELQGEISNIDQMSEKAERAAELIKFCKNKLRHTETQVNYLIEETLTKQEP